MTALALASASFAQQADNPPIPGTYYSAKDFEWSPPWPFNPHPELDAAEIAPGIFVFDDTAIPDTPEQAEARKRWQEADALAKAIAADPVLAAAARQEAEEAKRRAEEAWQQKKAALAPQLRPLIPLGQATSAEKLEAGEAELEALRQQAIASAAEQPAKDRALDDLAKKLNTAREIETGDGSKLILTGELADSPG